MHLFFFILKTKFKNIFDLFYKIYDDLTYPKKHLLFNSIEDLQRKMNASFFFYKFCDEKQNNNKIIKIKTFKSPSDRVTVKF